MIKRARPEGLQATIDTKDLRLACSRLALVAESKATMPALACVLIEAKDGQLSFDAYDLQVRLATSHKASVDREGLVAVPVKMLRGIAQTAAGETVRLEALDAHRLALRSGRTEYEIAGIAPEDVPVVATPENIDFTTVDAVALAAMIDAVRSSVCGDSARYNLCGAYLERTALGLRLTATDGCQLATIDRHVDDVVARAVPRPVLVPAKALDALRALLSEVLDEADPDVTIELGFNEKMVAVRRDGLDMVAPLIDGQFPDYRTIIPSEETISTVSFEVSRHGLHGALERLNPVAAKDTDHRVTAVVSSKQLRLRSETQAGHIAETLDIENKGTGRLTFSIDAVRLRSALEAMGDAFVVLSMEDAGSPVVLRPKDSALQVHLVMPLRLDAVEVEKAADQHLDALPALRTILIEQDRRTEAMERVRHAGRVAGKKAREEQGGPVDVKGRAADLSGLDEPLQYVSRTLAETVWLAGFVEEATKPIKAPVSEENSGDETPPAPDVSATAKASSVEETVTEEPKDDPKEELHQFGKALGEKELAGNKGKQLPAWGRGKWPSKWTPIEKSFGRELSNSERKIVADAHDNVVFKPGKKTAARKSAPAKKKARAA